jgi:hypothetical protein
MTPQGFEERIDFWRVQLAPLGLSHWRFEFEYSDDLEDNTGGDADAGVRVHKSYDTAFWDVTKRLLEMDQAEVDKTIVHELMHVVMRDLNSVEQDMLEELGGRQAALLEERLEHEIEGLVERLARAIVMSSAVVVP